MSIRVDVLEGGKIELGWFDREGEKRAQRYMTADVSMANIIFRTWLDREIEQERKSRFVSQQEKEARAAFKQLEKESPYHGKRR